MIDQHQQAGSLSPAGQRPWRMTLDERGKLVDPPPARPGEAQRNGSGVRLVLGLACLGSALISVTALLLVFRWMAPP